MITSTESRGLPFIVATFLGVGLSPVAPGTVGSIAALPLAVLLLHWPILFSSATLVVLFMLGTWCANHLERATGLHGRRVIARGGEQQRTVHVSRLPATVGGVEAYTASKANGELVRL